MQGCHQLQIHLIVLLVTDNMMAHEMDRKLQTGEEEGFKDKLRTAIQNNVNQWTQSDPGLGEWVKENDTLKILEVVLLRLPQDLWASKNLALVVKNKAHAQALEHLLSCGAMPTELNVTAGTTQQEGRCQ